MSSIELRHVKKTYDNGVTVIEDMNLVIPDGSFTVLVGPSGCGKTTTLRMIAGLEEITEGDLLIDGVRMNDVDPGDRNIAMVFQNYALYPTMTVRGNIEFGLINAKVPKEERERRIEYFSRIVGLTEYLDRKPSQLSGGQRQRVALARAMVKHPKVFLMDEPLSNLDAKLRAQMRTELIALHQRLGTTFVYVTHDQTEAMSMATKIVLMNEGKIQQAAEPLTIYGDPANKFVAQFIGVPTMNVFERASLPDLGFSDDVAWVGFRPSRALFAEKVLGSHPNGEKAMTDAYVPKQGDLVFGGTIAIREIMGSEIIYQAETGFGNVSFKTFNQPQVDVGTQVKLCVDRSSLYLFGSDEKRVVA
ncbi:MAG: ABC transporter ATP-binding protein [Tractidigestivibacter sp.]|uniref:ABC transporter ATP-binding protein n=1 Tax=Tractidigestivibacter sp. TaxID=2847320 RepID=UPI003D8C592A